MRRSDIGLVPLVYRIDGLLTSVTYHIQVECAISLFFASSFQKEDQSETVTLSSKSHRNTKQTMCYINYLKVYSHQKLIFCFAFQVRAKTAAGAGPWSETVTAFTIVGGTLWLFAFVDADTITVK